MARRRVRVSGDPWTLGSDGFNRLVVHLYEAFSGDESPHEYSRPRASAQRAITAEELRNGVDITLHESLSGPPRDVVVVAWIEPGEADLDFDGAEATPSAAAYLGRSDALSIEGDTQIVLRHQGLVRHQAA
jgi:hypothetical protein